MTNRLAGKRIVITGAAQGIGLAITEACLAEGARLFLIDRDRPLLESAVDKLRARSISVGFDIADISDAAAVLAAVN